MEQREKKKKRMSNIDRIIIFHFVSSVSVSSMDLVVVGISVRVMGVAVALVFVGIAVASSLPLLRKLSL